MAFYVVSDLSSNSALHLLPDWKIKLAKTTKEVETASTKKLEGGLRSTEEAFLLPTQQPWVQIPAPLRYFLEIFLFTA